MIVQVCADMFLNRGFGGRIIQGSVVVAADLSGSHHRDTDNGRLRDIGSLQNR
jgi:hypothetical protein